MKTMFDGDLSPSKTANKGYSATFLDWVADVKENQEEGGPCIIDTSNDDFTVIEQIWWSLKFGTYQILYHANMFYKFPPS